MGHVAYVNGRFVPHAAASVHIEDRGYQFADGVYEVCALRAGRFLDEEGHWQRLQRSLGELAMESPLTTGALRLISRELVRRNRVENALLYIQVTRGVAPRDHSFPKGVRASIVMTVKHFDFEKADARAAAGIAVQTLPDLRWARCDIKSVGLLANVLAKQAAKSAGAYEAWLIDEAGAVTEGASSNAWIVTAEGKLVTRHLDEAILPGITRQTILRVAAERQLAIEERAFDLDEAKTAREAFISSATTFVTPVTQIDGVAVGDGKPGAVGRALREAYLAAVA